MGLTLHAAQTVVFIELSWLPGDLLQAEVSSCVVTEAVEAARDSVV